MYASIYSDETRSSVNSTFTNKIDEVCQLLLDAMSEQKERYILPIISCYVKSSKSKVDYFALLAFISFLDCFFGGKVIQ